MTFYKVPTNQKQFAIKEFFTVVIKQFRTPTRFLLLKKYTYIEKIYHVKTNIFLDLLKI